MCYRMTGNAADSEDIVQEVFVKALEKPPCDTGQPWRPWLVRVAINLSRDYLRRRRRQGYTGPWLPSPLPTEMEESPEARQNNMPSARYDLTESITIAFLLALEALTPAQRAVLLLRDVFDYPADEVADLLGMTGGNIRVTLHRARRTMKEYDRNRVTLGPVCNEKTRSAIERFIECLKNRDAKGLEQILTEDIVVISDGGGEVIALRSPMRGRHKVLQLVTRLNEVYGETTRTSLCTLNGLPALLASRDNVKAGHASRFTMQCEVDNSGRIARLSYVFAPSKLTALETLAK
jgi:RNA polymerase sigma-70 factor, ECF subfamily